MKSDQPKVALTVLMLVVFIALVAGAFSFATGRAHKGGYSGPRSEATPRPPTAVPDFIEVRPTPTPTPTPTTPGPRRKIIL